MNRIIKTNKCNIESCNNIVEIYEHSKYKYREESKFMSSTTSGYRCCSGCSKQYHFCSDVCLKYFEAHSKCFRCHENCIGLNKGTFIEELNITLCNGRGDHNPPCYNKYQLEKRFEKDYQDNNTQYIGRFTKDVTEKYKTFCNIPDEYDEIFKIISDNNNKISLDILRDINHIDNTYNIRERTENINDIIDESDNLDYEDENYIRYNCVDCKKPLNGTFYYVGGDIDGLTCCNIRIEQHYNSWFKYFYKDSSGYFIVEIYNL